MHKAGVGREGENGLEGRPIYREGESLLVAILTSIDPHLATEVIDDHAKHRSVWLARPSRTTKSNRRNINFEALSKLPRFYTRSQ